MTTGAVKPQYYPNGNDIPEPLTRGIRRVGVIPYCRVFPSPSKGSNDDATMSELWFAIAVDSTYGELTDCGGFRTPKDLIEHVAVKELFEESLKIFDLRFNESLILRSPAVLNGSVCIFFLSTCPGGDGISLPLRFPNGLADEFASRRNAMLAASETSIYSNRKFLENESMYWISEQDLHPIVMRRVKRRGEARGSGGGAEGGSSPRRRMYERVRRLLAPVWSNVVTDLP